MVSNKICGPLYFGCLLCTLIRSGSVISVMMRIWIRQNEIRQNDVEPTGSGYTKR